MKKIFEGFKWFCTVCAIAVVSVVAVGSLWEESAGNIVSEIGAGIFCFLTICAAMYWSYWCFERMDKKDKKKEAE